MVGLYSIAHAQYALSTENDIIVNLLPTDPAPGNRVYATAESYATNLDGATIRWTLNGKEIAKGTGVKNVSFIVGKLGQQSLLQVDITTAEGVSVQKEIRINPASVDILWEANTYTPPFYKGKSLFTPESTITFEAVPHIMRNGKEIPAQNLIYKWTQNGTVLGDTNGYGKNKISFVGSIISRPIQMEVEVTDPISNDVAYSQINVTPADPMVMFYEKDPLYGVSFAKAFGSTVSLVRNELEVLAVPFFYSPTNLEYVWTVNNDTLPGDNGPSKVFRRVGDTFGIATVNLQINNTNKVLQTGQRFLNINFTKESTSF